MDNQGWLTLLRVEATAHTFLASVRNTGKQGWVKLKGSAAAEPGFHR